MCVMSEFPGRELDQRIFHFSRGLPRRDPRAVGDAEDVSVDGYCRLAEDCVQDHVRSFATHSRKFFECLARARHFAPVFVGNRRRGRDHVLRLGLPQADRADVFRESVDAEFRNGLAEYGQPGTVYGSPRSRSCPWPARKGSPPPAVRTASEYSSSVVGCGLAARKRSKISRRLAAFMAAVSGTRAAFLVGEHRGAFRGAARHAFVVRVETRARVVRRAAAPAWATGSRAAESSRCSPPGRAPRTARSPCTAPR